MKGLLGGGGSESAKTQSVNQTNSPPAYLEPYLKDIVGKGQTAYNDFIAKGYNMPYSGDRSAGRNQYDTMSLNSALGAGQRFSAEGAPQNTYELGRMFQDKVTGGAYTAPGSMAFDSGSYDLNAAIEANINPIIRNFSESIVPQLKSSAIDAGAYGGSKATELNSRVAQNTQDQIGNMAAQLTYQDFLNKRAIDQQDLAQRRQLTQTGLQQELAAGGFIPDMFSTALGQDLQLSDITSNVADRERAFGQQEINEEIARWDELTNSPFAGLDKYAQLVFGTAGNAGGTKTSDTIGYQPSGASFLQGLSGLGSLASAGAGLFNSGAAAATGLPWLASGGGAAGVGSSMTALLAMMSDIRLKENIQYVGEEKGHKLYSFNYIWSPIRYIGVMAQEVLEKMPEAVSKVGDYLAVNYAKLGLEMRRV